MSRIIHTVISGQSLMDLANRYAGTIEALVELAEYNDLSPSDTLYPGQEILIPSVFTNYNAEVVDYFNRKNIQLATNGTNA